MPHKGVEEEKQGGLQRGETEDKTQGDRSQVRAGV